MTEHWKDIISDEEEEKVFEALGDSDWDFRTLEGIEGSTSLSEEKIQETIDKYPNLIRKSLTPDKQGRAIYTLVGKTENLVEWAKNLKTFISKST